MKRLSPTILFTLRMGFATLAFGLLGFVVLYTSFNPKLNEKDEVLAVSLANKALADANDGQKWILLSHFWKKDRWLIVYTNATRRESACFVVVDGRRHVEIMHSE